MGAALLQRGGCALLCLALLLLGCWAELGSGLEFPGAEGQWTRFPKWNACCESELSFELKTRAARGLVLYFDDEGFCDFLELVLTRGGRLQLSFSIFCAEPATLLADTPLNDGAWHRVRLRRQFRNTTLLVDRAEARWVEVQSRRRDMTVFSGLFVGGLPPELRASALKARPPATTLVPSTQQLRSEAPPPPGSDAPGGSRWESPGRAVGAAGKTAAGTLPFSLERGDLLVLVGRKGGDGRFYSGAGGIFGTNTGFHGYM
ncbi:neurexin-1-like [Octodon degus]|uniref:Neurexin-1-like n=1 Tax=Octodon degus TaxID=10160 RepID=A0A6P6DH43_OCTDE|nr:neurexin-1-like [Octodon degus]